MATCLEKPHNFTNRWIVSRHEELALTDPDVADECEVGSADPCPEAEPLDRPPLTPGARKPWSLGPIRSYDHQ